MNAAEISTVEEAAAFFTRMAAVVPGHKVCVRVETRGEYGNRITNFTEPVRAVFNPVAKRIEIEVEP